MEITDKKVEIEYAKLNKLLCRNIRCIISNNVINIYCEFLFGGTATVISLN